MIPVKVITSPFLRTVQSAAFLANALAQNNKESSENNFLPSIFLEKNISNRLSGKKNRIFDDGVLAIEHLKIEAG